MQTPDTPAQQQAHDAQIAQLGAERAQAQAVVDRQVQNRDSDSAYQRLSYDAKRHAAFQARVEALDTELDALQDAYGGWPRYFHVQNNNGHIHTSTWCTSCFPDTQFSWRTDLSGLAPAQVVKQEAHNACSVCMPIAPVEQRQARERYNAAQRDAKRTEREAAKAAKFEKALERARKHADKVAKALVTMTGESDLDAALEVFNRDWSLYGHDGRRSVYGATFDMPSQVGDTLYYLAERKDNPSKRSLHEPNEAGRKALVEKGLI